MDYSAELYHCTRCGTPYAYVLRDGEQPRKDTPVCARCEVTPNLDIEPPPFDVQTLGKTVKGEEE